MVNKYDLNMEKTKEIEDFAKRQGMPVLGRIPFDTCVHRAITNLEMPYNRCETVKKSVDGIFRNIMESL